ncbi:MAG TPA: class I SAM-dependent rRNA methyltransferase [Acidobacteriaceae bacterium]|nr:class I SAM-dependent rRNA methyltransferase [Acidobacteriaceae bacterium]
MTSTLRITRRAADRLRSGHLWVYRSDIEHTDDALEPGALVTIADNRKIPLGTALYSTTSQIAARLVSRTPALTRQQYLADLRSRIQTALQLRRELAPLTPDNNAHRLIFAEADNLPGIIADRYNDLVILQLLSQGTAQDDVREVIVETLRAHLAPENQPLTIWERPDPRIRELEHLRAPAPGALFTNAPAEPPTTTTFTLNGLQFHYDAFAGQKTGAFLDQRLNYAAAARHVLASGRTGRALDICTYQGGFALHLARVCSEVTGLDQSRSALEAAERNLNLNSGLRTTVDWVEADAFALLRAFDDALRSMTHSLEVYARGPLPIELGAFDAIVLDPPAFAKSKRATEGALRGYKELNLRAIRLLAPGGTLITCSCSHHVSLADFTEIVGAAAADAGRRVQLLETRAAAPDHPQVLTLPETGYLKCLICRVD